MKQLKFFIDVIGIIVAIVGVVYAILGETDLTLNGRPVPAWMAFMLRLFCPLFVMGIALYTSGIEGFRERRLKASEQKDPANV